MPNAEQLPAWRVARFKTKSARDEYIRFLQSIDPDGEKIQAEPLGRTDEGVRFRVIDMEDRGVLDAVTAHGGWLVALELPSE